MIIICNTNLSFEFQESQAVQKFKTKMLNGIYLIYEFSPPNFTHVSHTKKADPSIESTYKKTSILFLSTTKNILLYKLPILLQ